MMRGRRAKAARKPAPVPVVRERLEVREVLVRTDEPPPELRPAARVDPAPRGLAGIFEHSLRRFRVTVHVLTLMPLYALACVCVGIAAAPGIALVRATFTAAAAWPEPLRSTAPGAAIAAGYFL